MWADQVSISYVFSTEWKIHDKFLPLLNSSIVGGVYKGFKKKKKSVLETKLILTLKLILLHFQECLLYLLMNKPQLLYFQFYFQFLCY